MSSGGGNLDHTSQLQSNSPIAPDAVGPMADLHFSLEASGVSVDDKAAMPSESMLWEGWHPSMEAATLPELVPASSSRLSFHHQADMLSTMLSHFHTDGQTNSFFQESAEQESFPRNVYLSGIPCPMPPKQEVSHFVYASKPAPSLWGPESPSSPLALQGWPPVAENSSHEERAKRQLELFSFADRRNHVMVPNVQSSEIHNLGWATAAPPEAYNSLLEPGSFSRGGTTRSQQFMNFVRIAQEQQGSDPGARGYGEVKAAGMQQYSGGEEQALAPKRPHLSQQPVDSGAALWRNAPQRSPASQAMEIYAIGPALNTNGKPRARRGSATDPQSVYARHRREKINERLKTLQHLVPNGAKVDIVTMLDEAVHYVKFLQHQVKLLQSDKYWIHATPNTYKGIDLTQTQGQGPSA